MTHITLSKATHSKPCLEYYSDGSGERRRVEIDQCPYKIGRAETSSLRIESVQVSREHAEIFERHGVWLVRDLGSTNGTHVNGKRIKETLLSDGDILKIAETELTFVASAASQFQRMVTQPIQKNLVVARDELPVEVATMRMLTEATLNQVIPVQLNSINSMRLKASEGFVALTNSLPAFRAVLNEQLPVSEHYRDLERRRSLELALPLAEVKRLYLPIGSADASAPHRLFSSLRQLRWMVPSDWELGISIPVPDDADVSRFTDIYREAQDNDLRVAFVDFLGTGSQVLHLKLLLPDYLLLSPSMLSNLAVTRQPLRRLESVVAACEELAIKPVLPRIESQQSLDQCQEVGFDLYLSEVSEHDSAVHRAASLSV